MYSYKQLLCFATIVEEGGFTPAAHKLFMTQPAISWQIKILERDLDLILIERSERKLILTDAGKLFYGNTKKILNQYSSLENDMEQFKNMEKGILKLGASTIPGEYLIAKYIALFNKKHPKSTLQVEVGDSEKILKSLYDESINIGIIGFHPEDTQINATPVFHDELVLIANSKHPLTTKEDVSLEDVLKQEILVREQGSGTRKELEVALNEKNILLKKIKMELGSTRAIISAVEANLGISWVSKIAIEEIEKIGNIKVIPVRDFVVQREFYIIDLKARTLSPIAKAFTECIEKCGVENETL